MQSVSQFLSDLDPSANSKPLTAGDETGENENNLKFQSIIKIDSPHKSWQ